MNRAKSIIVAGLGFGDEGKGSIVDFLCSRLDSKLVCRYNGGPQAAHHVVAPDGRWHCFSQFGSGSFLPHTNTHLSSNMLVKPSNLLVERDALASKGIAHAGDRVTIDPHCCIVSPFHGLLNRMEETARGAKRLGSVGMGVGKAANERETNPEALRIKDLYSDALGEKVRMHVEQYEAKCRDILEKNSSDTLNGIYQSRITAEALTDFYSKFANYTSSIIHADMSVLQSAEEHTPVIFEGAQGILLDRRYGLTPHVTKTDVTFNSSLSVTSSLKDSRAPLKLGILRAYSTRHGAGPFVAEDESIYSKLPEYHNGTNEWQGAFRAGLFDLVMARYAISISGGTDAIALTCLDRLEALGEVKICTHWHYNGSDSEAANLFHFEAVNGSNLVSGIKIQAPETQDYLALAMRKCTPAAFKSFGAITGCDKVKTFDQLPNSAKQFISYLESVEGLGLPVALVSVGATREAKIENPHHSSIFE